MHDNKMQYFDENFKIDENHSLLIYKITEIINKEKILKKESISSYCSIISS